jgi:RNA polymerase sigma factor (sigma-70 family)
LADELTTEALLRRCRKRPPDEAAWQEFVRRYHSIITVNVAKAFHLKVGQELERRSQFPKDSIDDLVQTVYFRLIDGNCRVLKAFHGELENSLPAYLSMISMNVVKDHFRRGKAGKRPKITFSLDELLETGGEGGLLKGVSSDIDGKRSGSGALEFQIEEIDALLNKALTRRDRDRNILMFKLRYCEGLTLEEIRNTLGLDMSPRGIGSILSRINARIRQSIQEKSKRKRE